MFFFVLIILFSILFSLVIFFSYWDELLRRQDSYSREELIDFFSIYKKQIEKMNPDFSLMGFIAFALGITTGWFLTLLGGFLSPDSGAEPDFASSEISNYFFQSFLFVGILHIIWPSLKQYLEEKSIPHSILNIIYNEKSFFCSLAISLTSITLASWGVYHKMSFLFFLINAFILLTYAGYQIQKNSEIRNYKENQNNSDNELEL